MSGLRNALLSSLEWKRIKAFISQQQWREMDRGLGCSLPFFLVGLEALG